MSRNDVRLFLGIIVVLGGLALVGAGASSNGNIVASGSITDLDVSDGRGFNRTFSFTAVRSDDGTVSGQGFVVRTPPGTADGLAPTHFSVDCVHVDTSFQGLPTATLGGVVTNAPDPALVGSRFLTRVVDGGQTDWNTGFATFAVAPFPCTSVPELPLSAYFPGDGGNITVRLPD